MACQEPGWKLFNILWPKITWQLKCHVLKWWLKTQKQQQQHANDVVCPHSPTVAAVLNDRATNPPNMWELAVSFPGSTTAELSMVLKAVALLIPDCRSAPSGGACGPLTGLARTVTRVPLARDATRRQRASGGSHRPVASTRSDRLTAKAPQCCDVVCVSSHHHHRPALWSVSGENRHETSLRPPWEPPRAASSHPSSPLYPSSSFSSSSSSSPGYWASRSSGQPARRATRRRSARQRAEK